MSFSPANEFLKEGAFIPMMKGHLISGYVLSRIQSELKYAGVIRLFFLIGHLYLIGMWSGEDQRTNTIKLHA
jgi:hypothetical protein